MEAAGLALAIFPVAVKCAEQWVDGVKLIREWRAWRPRLRSYSSKLETERVIYLNTLEQLLNEIATSEDEVAELISNPKSPMWRSKGYQDRLRNRLGRSYQPFMERTDELLKALTIFTDKLRVASSSDASILKREYQRLKGTFLQKDYEELLRQIETANRDTMRLTKQSRDIRTERQKHCWAKPRVDFKRIRSQARSLYNVCVKRCWTCQCRNRHIVNLRLEPRPWDFGDRKLRRDRRDRFLVLLWNEVLSTTPVCKWTHRQIQIEPLELPSKPQTLPKGRNLDVKSKAVRFADVLPSQVHPAIETSLSLLQVSPNAVQISDLCEALVKAEAINEYIGFLADERHHHDVYCLDSIEAISSLTMKISLDELLEKDKSLLRTYYMSRRDRLNLGIIIASSVLQLNGTQWLRQTFRSSDFSFFCSADLKIDYSCPYLSQQVALPDETVSSQDDTAPDLVAHVIRSKPLFALGQSLIELSLNQTISPQQEPQHHDLVSMATALKTAHDLLPQVEGESGVRYGDIVRCCLECPFEVRLKDLDNEEFQQAVFHRIVVPLMEELETFDGSAGIR